MILPDGEKLWDPTLRRIDEVLEDEELIAQVEAALRRRRPKSRLLGRRGTPAAVALRMLVLKRGLWVRLGDFGTARTSWRP